MYSYLRLGNAMSVSRGSKIFVALIFVLIGITFLATTGVLYYEFRADDWFSHLALYSHLFLFFPTFGILALFAFYVPSVVFTDLYWKHVQPAGRFRFVFGFLVVAGVSGWLAWMILDSRVPTYWQLTPDAINNDKGAPSNCGRGQTACNRASIMDAISKVRLESQKRMGLANFIRICKVDPLLEIPHSVSAKRYCFASGRKMTAADCCRAQKSFSNNLKVIFENPDNRSLTGFVHAILLPFKVFFLLVLFVVGVLLAVWRHKVKEHYAPLVAKIERGVIVGALAVLFFPAANHGFLQSASVTYGPFGETVYPTLALIVSIAFGAWTVFLMFFFFSRFHKDMESMMRTIGFLASAVAIFQYDAIINYAVRYMGAGSDRIIVLFYIVIAIVGIGALHRFGADEVAPERDT